MESRCWFHFVTFIENLFLVRLRMQTLNEKREKNNMLIEFQILLWEKYFMSTRSMSKKCFFFRWLSFRKDSLFMLQLFNVRENSCWSGDKMCFEPNTAIWHLTFPIYKNMEFGCWKWYLLVEWKWRAKKKIKWIWLNLTTVYGRWALLCYLCSDTCDHWWRMLVQA